MSGSIEEGSGNHASELASGERFAFGDNWRRFLAVVDEERIASARTTLERSLRTDSLDGRTFLDVGSGSGLSSLAAHRLGATVHSFDFDPASVECTRELKRRFADDADDWQVESGSVLDRAYMDALGGNWDIVYSWGVLHHTGAMYDALENVAPRVAIDGTLLLALYNDQGGQSRRWTTLKRMYNALPAAVRPLYTALVMGPRELRFLALDTLRGRPQDYAANVRNYASQSLRGMSYWHDIVDWIGGYPFEVATPEAIFEFYRERGFALDGLITCGGGLGCNEFVFKRTR